MIIDVYFGDKKLPWYIDTELKSMSDANVKLTIKDTAIKPCLKIEDLKVGDYFTWKEQIDNPIYINLKISKDEFMCVWQYNDSNPIVLKALNHKDRSAVKLNLKELVFEKEV